MERAVNWLSGNPVSVPGTGHSMVSAFEEFGSQGLGWRAGGRGGGWRSPVSRNHLCNKQLPQ